MFSIPHLKRQLTDGASVPPEQAQEMAGPVAPPREGEGLSYVAPSGTVMIYPEPTDPSSLPDHPKFMDQREVTDPLSNFGKPQTVKGDKVTGGLIGPPMSLNQQDLTVTYDAAGPSITERPTPQLDNVDANRFAALTGGDYAAESDAKKLGQSYEDFEEENPGATRSDYAQQRFDPRRRQQVRDDRDQLNREQDFENVSELTDADGNLLYPPGSPEYVFAEGRAMGLDLSRFGNDHELAARFIEASKSGQERSRQNRDRAFGDRVLLQYNEFMTPEDQGRVREIQSDLVNGTGDREGLMNELRDIRRGYQMTDQISRRRTLNDRIANRVLTNELNNPYARQGLIMRALSNPNATPEYRAAIYSGLGLSDQAAQEMELAVQREMEDGATARAGAIAESNVRAAEASRQNQPPSVVQQHNQEMDAYVQAGDWNSAMVLALAAHNGNADVANMMLLRRFVMAGQIDAAQPGLAPIWNASKGVESTFVQTLTSMGIPLDDARNAYLALSGEPSGQSGGLPPVNPPTSGAPQGGRRGGRG